MAKARTAWRCQTCGAKAARWVGRCSECGEFGTYVEEAERREERCVGSGGAIEAISLDEVRTDVEDRSLTGVEEFDRVVGGGLVKGSLVLIGGEPGIGKSTLLLQVAAGLAARGRRTLVVCGEESPAQIRLRAERLGVGGSLIGLLPEVDVQRVEASVLLSPPDLLIIDSVQTAFDPDLDSAPGSVGQVRAVTARLMRMAKDRGVTTVIVGHVTKEGSIAGPRVLEHMVDAVLYFEGDRDNVFRVVRSVKNRFGAANEVGIFEMGEGGLVGVEQPSSALLTKRPHGVPGSSVAVAMEGSRPLLVEVQALVAPSFLQMPRRLATGIDTGRMLQALAVLERHAGVSFAQHDVYVGVSGGVKVVEPAADLPLVLALLSARCGRPVEQGLASFGEVCLTGEVRPVGQSQRRALEAYRVGMDALAIAEGGWTPEHDMRTLRLCDVRAAAGIFGD